MRFGGLVAVVVVTATFLALGGCAARPPVVYGSEAEEPQAGDALPARLDSDLQSIASFYPDRMTGWQVRVARNPAPRIWIVVGTWNCDGVERVTACALRDDDPGGVGRALAYNGVRVPIVYGWVTDSTVSSFALRLSDRREVVLNAATHPYFLMILGDKRQPAITVERIVVRDAGGNIVADYSPGQ